MELTAEERRRLRGVITRLQLRNESILTQVVRGKTSGPDGQPCYIVLDFDGSTICQVDEKHGVRDIGTWLAMQAGGVVSCTCGAELLPGETGLCGPCEAETVMSLIRIRDQTA